MIRVALLSLLLGICHLTIAGSGLNEKAQIHRPDNPSDQIAGLAVKATEIPVESEGTPPQYFVRLSLSFLAEGRSLLIDETPLKLPAASVGRANVSLRVRLVGKTTPIRVVAMAEGGQLQEEKMWVRFDRWPAEAASPSPSTPEPTTEPGFLSNRIDSLHFYVPKGHLYGSLIVTPYLEDTGSNTSNGQPSSSVKQSETETSLNVSYGILDGLRAAAEIGYEPYQNIQNFDAQGNLTSTDHEHGFSNPTFQLLYRPLNETQAGLYGDVAVSYIPSLTSHVNATTAQDGTYAASDSVVALDADFYWATGNHEIGLVLTGQYQSSGTNQSSTTSNVNSFASLTVFTGRLRYRLHLGDRFFVQPALYFYFPYSQAFNYPNQNPVLTKNYSFPLRVAAHMGVGYRATDSLVLSATLFYWDYTKNYTQSTDSNAYTSESKQIYLNLQVTLLF